MRKVTVSLRSTTPYGQSKFVMEPRKTKENADDHEKRTWKQRCHYNESGHIFIPPLCFKNSIQEAAKFTKQQIPGRGKETYTKHFESGILITEGIVLPETEETVQGVWLKLPADGRVGGTTRVSKCMPIIPSWKGIIEIYVLDDTLTSDVVEATIKEAGLFVGIGYWRPSKRGMWGRFIAEKFVWEEMDLEKEMKKMAA